MYRLMTKRGVRRKLQILTHELKDVERAYEWVISAPFYRWALRVELLEQSGAYNTLDYCNERYNYIIHGIVPKEP